MTNDLKVLEKRIEELGNKSTQLLLFLTFAIVGAATLNPGEHSKPPALFSDQQFVGGVWLCFRYLGEFCR
jgi:hypothetical protein